MIMRPLAITALSMGIGSLNNQPAYAQIRNAVDHYATPKPLTKRQKRRLRGKDRP